MRECGALVGTGNLTTYLGTPVSMGTPATTHACFSTGGTAEKRRGHARVQELEGIEEFGNILMKYVLFMVSKRFTKAGARTARRNDSTSFN